MIKAGTESKLSWRMIARCKSSNSCVVQVVQGWMSQGPHIQSKSLPWVPEVKDSIGKVAFSYFINNFHKSNKDDFYVFIYQKLNK